MADAHPLYPQLPARERGAVDAALDLLYVVAYGTSHEVEADGLLRSARAELEHLIPAGPLVEDLTPDVEEAAEHERWIRQQVRVSQHDPSMGERAMGWAVGEIDRLRAEARGTPSSVNEVAAPDVTSALSSLLEWWRAEPGFAVIFRDFYPELAIRIGRLDRAHRAATTARRDQDYPTPTSGEESTDGR